jgi:hypothetical protein
VDALQPIRAALKERRLLEFSYDGLERLVLPMTLGVGRKGGWKLRGQQLAGRSRSGHVGDGSPKLFNAAEIVRPVATDAGFEIPADYARGDQAFKFIDTQL